eukprot:688654-Rhodomonas_salina.2
MPGSIVSSYVSTGQRVADAEDPTADATSVRTPDLISVGRTKAIDPASLWRMPGSDTADVSTGQRISSIMPYFSTGHRIADA